MVNSRCPMGSEPTTGSGCSQEVGQMQAPGGGQQLEELFACISGCELYPDSSTEQCGDPAVAQLLFHLRHQKNCKMAVPQLVRMVCAPHLAVLKQGGSLGCCYWCGEAALSFREI